MKPQIGEIWRSSFGYSEEHHLVLEVKKTKITAGHKTAECKLLSLESGNISIYDVFYTLRVWQKVA